MTSRRAPEESVRKITRGGALLLAFIRREYASIPLFCTAHPEFERIHVQRMCNGSTWKRVSVDFAFAIERVTRGAVPAKAWMSGTAKESRAAA